MATSRRDAGDHIMVRRALCDLALAMAGKKISAEVLGVQSPGRGSRLGDGLSPDTLPRWLPSGWLQHPAGWAPKGDAPSQGPHPHVELWRQAARGGMLSAEPGSRAERAAVSRKIYNAPKEIVQKLQTKHAQEDIKYRVQGHPPIIT